MLNEKDFLKHPPQGIDIKQRLTFEGIGYAVDALEISYERLKKHAAVVIELEANKEGIDRTSMFVDAWAMVDHGHSLLQLLLTLKNEIWNDTIEGFVEEHAAVTRLRNNMDHLSSNLNNLVNSKGRRPPIYGGVSFISTKRDEDGQFSKSSMVTITAGALNKPKLRLRIANPAGQIIELPVGFFHLTAFDSRENLSALYQGATVIRDHFNTEVARHACAFLKEHAEEHGEDIRTLLAPVAAGLMITVDFKFDKVDPESQNVDQAT